MSAAGRYDRGMAQATSSEPNERTRQSSDPDYRRLWSMSFRELAEIEKDPDNPLHEKAKIVGREVAEPIRSAMQFSSANLVKQFGIGLGDWAKQAVGVSFTGLPNAVSPLTHHAGMIDAIPHVEASFNGSGDVSVDIEADEPPEASAAQVQDAMQAAANGLLERLVFIQSKQLENQESEASKSEVREKVSRWILWGTLTAAVLTLVATVVLGLPGFLENIA